MLAFVSSLFLCYTAPMAMVLGARSTSRTKHGLLYMRVEQRAPMAMVLGVRSTSRTEHGLLYMSLCLPPS